MLDRSEKQIKVEDLLSEFSWWMHV
jgi:hypothetical protein